MLTINQIKRKLKEIQENHLRLNSFYFGDFSSIGASEPHRYSLLAADLLPGTLIKGIRQSRLILVVADLVNEDESNKNEVLSDTERDLLDVYSQLWEYLEVNGIELMRDGTITDFSDRWDDNVAGHQIEITIQQFFANDRCQIPSTLEPATADDGTVIIYDQDGSIITRLNEGNSYMVLRFSGIIDNGPPYTNTLVDNG